MCTVTLSETTLIFLRYGFNIVAYTLDINGNILAGLQFTLLILELVIPKV